MKIEEKKYPLVKTKNCHIKITDSDVKYSLLKTKKQFFKIKDSNDKYPLVKARNCHIKIMDDDEYPKNGEYNKNKIKNIEPILHTIFEKDKKDRKNSDSTFSIEYNRLKIINDDVYIRQIKVCRIL